MKDDVRALMLDLSVADDEVHEATRLYADAERRLLAARVRQSAARKAIEDRLRQPSPVVAGSPTTCGCYVCGGKCGRVAEKYPHTTDYEVGS